MIYDFKCHSCGKIFEDVTLPISHTDEEHPICCEPTRHHISKAPSIRWRDPDLLNGGFIAHSMPDRPVITSMRQNRELMKRHDLIDANEMGLPPTKAEQMEQHHETMKSIEAITPTASQKARLKADGLDAIV